MNNFLNIYSMSNTVIRSRFGGKQTKGALRSSKMLVDQELVNQQVWGTLQELGQTISVSVSCTMSKVCLLE